MTPDAGHDGQTRPEREAHREWLAWCDGRHAAEMGNGNPYRRGSKQHAAWEKGAHHTVALHVLAFITDLCRLPEEERGQRTGSPAIPTGQHQEPGR